MGLTGKLGEYQNTISALSGLDIGRYERIFKIYTEPTNNKQFYFYNILTKIEFPPNINSEMLDLYNVKHRMPLTTISNDIYEDIHSWWLIYLANKQTLKNAFYAEGGTQLKFVKPESLALVYNQITRSTTYNNRHF